ncbi:MAG: M43 family zinc metalloprotease, partial [Chitinophagales bacterium]
MRKIFTLILVALIATQSSFAQFSRCSTQEHEEMLKAKYPDYAQKRAQLEQFTTKFIEKKKSSGKLTSGVVITIPVVFHVVYKTAAQNIPDARLIEQIAILNEDFRRLNADTTDTPDEFADVAADFEIEFCIASVDPDGNPTTGIIRTETDVTSFNTNDDVKFNADGGDDAWPADDYLNFWTCNLGPFLLGYAQFPGGPANTDGVVIHCDHVGNSPGGYPYHLGRTATHEVGHWMNLYHIWGDDTNCAGSDLVGDTPNQKVETYGCPSFPETDMCSPSAPGIMFQNYMDYTDDACMNIFTEGQKNRMLSIFEPGGDRYDLTNSEGCGLQPYNAQALSSLPGGTVCELTITPMVTIKNHGTEILTSVDIVYSIDGGATSSFGWTGSLVTNATEVVTLPAVSTTEGEHTLEVTLENPNGFIDANTDDNTAESEFLVNLSALPAPLSQGFESGGFPYDGYSVFNPDAYYEWERTGDAAALGSYSIYFNHFDNDAPGEIDEFIIPAYDISDLPSVSFTFDVAYALYTASGIYSDTLEVLASINCGETWTTVYKKANPDLQTASPHTSAFVPEEDEWRNESVDLSSYLGAEQLFIKFRTISDYENNLYVDNIN